MLKLSFKFSRHLCEQLIMQGVLEHVTAWCKLQEDQDMQLVELESAELRSPHFAFWPFDQHCSLYVFIEGSDLDQRIATDLKHLKSTNRNMQTNTLYHADGIRPFLVKYLPRDIKYCKYSLLRSSLWNQQHSDEKMGVRGLATYFGNRDLFFDEVI